jgi:signal transduction histidine kinase/CheY-like chemotaxis protein
MDDTDTSAVPGLEDSDLLRDAMESLSEGIAVYGPDFRLITSNKRYSEMLHQVADLIRPGIHWRELLDVCVERGVYAESMGYAGNRISEIATRPHTFGSDIEIEHSDGRIYSVSNNPTRAGGFVVARADITDRRRAEDMSRDREVLLNTVLDTIPLPIVMARKESGEIIYRSAEAWKDYDPNKPYAQEHFDNPNDRNDYVAELEKRGEVADFRVDLRRTDGSIYRATLAGRLVEYQGDSFVVSAINDLSERLGKEELLRHVVEACPTPLTMTKLESGEVLFSSPEARALFSDQPTSKVFYVYPEARERYVEELKRKGFVYDYRVLLRTIDGREFWSASSARVIRYRGEDVIVAHMRDLTEQLSIEDQLAAQRDLMFQNEKMSALGELLAGVAHELNNPLSVVVGHALMLLEDEVDPDVRRHVEKISSAAERCSRIVRTFLTMARQQPARTERTDVNDLLRTAVDVARYGETRDIEVDLTLADGLPRICADADQITQVILNLILNAEQAIQGAGKGDVVRVSSRAAPSGEEVEIVVEDNGPGIPAAIQPRIFEPFFTTKDLGEGTGIGLALSHRIVHSHDGTIRLDARYRGGTRFVIRLPIGGPETASPEPAVADTHPSTPARVLIVDDETDVAELNGEVLSRGGYEVDVTHSVSDALELLRGGEYDLVLSDLNMPERDGRNLFETIGREFPHLRSRTGFVTGDTMGETSQRFLSEANRPYLEKPVAPSELLAFAGRILAAAGSSP